MVLPILVAYALVVGGSLVVGYTLDKVLGDGNYTAREATVDVAFGLLGIGALKVVKHAGKSVRYYRLAHVAGKADDVRGMRNLAGLGTHFGARAVYHANLVRIGENWASSVQSNPQASSSGVTITTVPNTVATVPGQTQAVISSTFSMAIPFPTRKRCPFTRKGRRCIKKQGHSGVHHYA